MVTKVKGLARAHPFVLVAGILLLIGAASAAWVVTSIYRIDSSVVYFGVPDAPQLTAGPGQTLYRVNASRSSVTYGVDEELAGTTHRATGSTKGIAGDILIDESHPAASQVGDIVVNVQQLTSDQNLRDERIRHEGLQSNDYPLATLRTSSITGMPDQIVDNTDYSIQLHGDLTVKTTTAPVVLDATAWRESGELQIKRQHDRSSCRRSTPGPSGWSGSYRPATTSRSTSISSPATRPSSGANPTWRGSSPRPRPRAVTGRRSRRSCNRSSRTTARRATRRVKRAPASGSSRRRATRRAPLVGPGSRHAVAVHAAVAGIGPERTRSSIR